MKAKWAASRGHFFILKLVIKILGNAWFTLLGGFFLHWSKKKWERIFRIFMSSLSPFPASTHISIYIHASLMSIACPLLKITLVAYQRVDVVIYSLSGIAWRMHFYVNFMWKCTLHRNFANIPRLKHGNWIQSIANWLNASRKCLYTRANRLNQVRNKQINVLIH